MKTIVDKANTRGYANHGWLKTHHTFSFANYYNPKRVHFGMLRVLNDDSIAPGEGFDTHPEYGSNLYPFERIYASWRQHPEQRSDYSGRYPGDECRFGDFP